MSETIYARMKAVLANKPKELSDLDEWLFVAVNTAKSIIDNTSKSDVGDVMKLAECHRTSQIQQEFDAIQGRYGREGFSQRHSSAYRYLCSLVANCPDRELSREDRKLAKQYNAINTYLLYDI